MKKFLKILSTFFAASLAFSGCSNPKKSTAKVQNSTVPQRIIQVGYAQVGHESAWRLANTESFKKTFTEENGYNLTFLTQTTIRKFRLPQSEILSQKTLTTL